MRALTLPPSTQHLLRQFASHSVRHSSIFGAGRVPRGPPDAILGITEAYKADPSNLKINLGVGAYRDDNGKPKVLNAVIEAEKRLLQAGHDKEYAGITGVPSFVERAMELAYGDVVENYRLAATQCLSGTGGLRIGGCFLSRFYPTKEIFVPSPTWGNHIPIFRDSGLEVRKYRYFDPQTNALDLKGMLADLSAAPEASIVLLHAVAHNPTGVDPKPSEWEDILNVVQQKKHYCFFDMAYQGFASGDIAKDAGALRTFVKARAGSGIMLSQSFAKNMGLYGERVGAFSVVCDDAEEQKDVLSQLKILIRPMYSNPPIHGARIASEILSNKDLYSLWQIEVKEMAGRVIQMRRLLKGDLEEMGSTRNWNHITDQIGMFCYTGLNERQVERMTKEFHVYLTKDGRISIAGITSKNVRHLAKAMHEVTK